MISLHRGRDGIGLDAHVDQTRQRGRGIVGMQGGQHKVTRLRGLDGDLAGFEVTNLTHHDHVRILTEESFQRARKGQADLRIDVHLVDAGQVDFGRILGRRDVALLGVEDVQTGVQRHRLTGTRRPGHENHAVGL